jgi:ribonuclease T
MSDSQTAISTRFRGFLPVVVDLETGGFNSQTDALLEIAAITLDLDPDGQLIQKNRYFFNVEPFKGANVEPSALEFTGIDIHNPLRKAVKESRALEETLRGIRQQVRATGCNRAVMVAHNASFDLGFMNAAVERCGIKRSPFHPFSTFDTATLCGLAVGQTVLSRACEVAGIDFNSNEAHSALYDCIKTAEIFCYIVNRWKELGGWPVNN